MYNFVASYGRIAGAALHKGLTAPLHADAIYSAARDYANNAGAGTTINALLAQCTTTEKGKGRTPTAGTYAGVMFACLSLILDTGADAGARPLSKAEKDAGETRDNAARDAAAHAYGVMIADGYCADLKAGADARKARAQAAKAVREAAAKGADDAPAAPAAPTVDKANPAYIAANLPAALALEALCSVEAGEFGAALRAKPEHASALRALFAGFEVSEEARKGAEARAEARAAAAAADAAAPAADAGAPVQPIGNSGARYAETAMAQALAAAGTAAKAPRGSRRQRERAAA